QERQRPHRCDVPRQALRGGPLGAAAPDTCPSLHGVTTELDPRTQPARASAPRAGAGRAAFAARAAAWLPLPHPLPPLSGALPRRGPGGAAAAARALPRLPFPADRQRRELTKPLACRAMLS